MRLLSPNPGVPVKLPKTLATVAGQLGLALLSLLLAVPAAADPATSPAGQPAQWIVVGVPAANATTGTLTAFQRVGQQWKVVLGPQAVAAIGVREPPDRAVHDSHHGVQSQYHRVWSPIETVSSSITIAPMIATAVVSRRAALLSFFM